MYQRLKPLLFQFDPETIHHTIMRGLSWSAHHPGALRIMSSLCRVQDERLNVHCLGQTFPNPIGLAAGFDKNAHAIPAWAALGYGYTEIGSVTAHAQPGNPKPRLFRLPEDHAIINRMGFNNDGANAVAQRLELLFADNAPVTPLGINVGKSKITALDDAAADYLHSLEVLWRFADYFVINVSSPNTPGLRELQDKDRLEALLTAVQSFAASQAVAKPVLLKIAPDLTFAQVDEILELIESCGLAGIIATNTTVSRDGLKTRIDEAGGLSGAPLREVSMTFLRYIRQHLRADLPVISVGGIATVDDVYERLKAGASLVQLYSSFIYEGPFLIKQLNQGLLKRLEFDGVGSVRELIASA